uniref:Uncharacterized protein n=1 Tax=viral metagenome TaxID=1070528 RepID=A0A6C0E2G9_9ZZZZ
MALNQNWIAINRSILIYNMALNQNWSSIQYFINYFFDFFLDLFLPKSSGIFFIIHSQARRSTLGKMQSPNKRS